jgi:hypothetical protein
MFSVMMLVVSNSAYLSDARSKQRVQWGSTYLQQARNFSIENRVFIGRFPCEMPPAFLTTPPFGVS